MSEFNEWKKMVNNDVDFEKSRRMVDNDVCWKSIKEQMDFINSVEEDEQE